MIRILIVDDEEAIRQLLRQMLTTNGYDCVLADDAAAARRHLSDKRFDLVISDLNMPGESGLDLLQHVMREHPRATTMMITGSHDPEAAQKALQLGVYGCLSKPFQFKELLACVAAALQAGSGNGRTRVGARGATAALKGAFRNVMNCAYRRPAPKLADTHWPSWNTHFFESGSH